MFKKIFLSVVFVMCVALPAKAWTLGFWGEATTIFFAKTNAIQGAANNGYTTRVSPWSCWQVTYPAGWLWHCTADFSND